MSDAIDYGEFESMSAEGLSTVSALVRELRAFNQAVLDKEIELDQLKAQRDAIEQRRLPDALRELGLTELRLEDGTRLTVAQEYHASIPAARRQEAFDWLRANGLADIIKTELVVTFSRGEEESAQRRYTAMRDLEPGRKILLGQRVEPQTLKALVRTRVEAGQPLPEQLFGVFIVDRAKLAEPKTKVLR